jgi:glycosyltransferase involved in cell wall biosynthesis
VRVVHLSTLHQPLDTRIFHKECRTLSAAGHEVHLLVADAPAVPLGGVRFHQLGIPTTGFRPARIVRRLLGVYKKAALLKGDLYHFHDPELIVVGLLLKRDGFRVIYDVHEDAPREAIAVNKENPLDGQLKSWAWSFLESAGRQAFDGFVCATPAIARHFPAQRTITVRNYPLLEEFPEPVQDGNERTSDLAYVGGLTVIRGVREMVGLLERLPESPPVQLVLAGPVNPPELLADLSALPGWRRVRYLGQLSRAGVQRVLGRARIGLLLLHPERIHLDSLPVKLFEYMAAGLPVVASDFPQWRDIVYGIGCGIMVDPFQPAAVAEAVCHLLDRPAEAAEMGRRGRAAVCERFNWQPEGQELLRLYDRLAA